MQMINAMISLFYCHYTTDPLFASSALLSGKKFENAEAAGEIEKALEGQDPKKCTVVHGDHSSRSLITALRVFINEALGDSFDNEKNGEDDLSSSLMAEEQAIQDTYELILKEISRFEKKLNN